MIRRLFFTIFYFIPSIMMAQSSFSITGNIAGLKDPATVYLALVQDGQYRDVDSASVKDGVFVLEGHLSHPQLAILNLKRVSTGTARQRPDQLSLFLENSAIKIIATDSIKDAVISGSIADQQKRTLERAIAPLTKTIMRIQDHFANKPKEELYIDGKPREEVARASDTVRLLVEQIRQINWDFVEANPDSYYALYVYNSNILGSKFDPQQVEPLFHHLNDELKSSQLGQQTLEKIQVAKRMENGVIAIDFTQNNLRGEPFTLSSLRGKYVLVDFWASWCAPCRAENPNLIKAYAALKDKKFEIVGVSLDQNHSAWENAVKTDNLPWIHVSDLKGWKNEVGILYGINSVPQNFLINPEGVIIGKNLRGEELTKKLAELIK